MMTAEPMVARGVHYTALVDTIDHQGATKLNARERKQLLEAADVLPFGEPDSEWMLRSAEVLIEDLETSKWWSVEVWPRRPRRGSQASGQLVGPRGAVRWCEIVGG
jgi:hypothetical protein